MTAADDERFLKLVDRINALDDAVNSLEYRVYDLERDNSHLQGQIDTLEMYKADR